jgi:hypothetical protein
VTGIAADGIESVVQLVKDEQDVNVVLTRTPSSKNWTAWGAECDTFVHYVRHRLAVGSDI